MAGPGKFASGVESIVLREALQTRRYDRFDGRGACEWRCCAPGDGTGWGGGVNVGIAWRMRGKGIF